MCHKVHSGVHAGRFGGAGFGSAERAQGTGGFQGGVQVQAVLPERVYGDLQHHREGLEEVTFGGPVAWRNSCNGIVSRLLDIPPTG